jgi:hypothetical protein
MKVSACLGVPLIASLTPQNLIYALRNIAQ